MVKYVAPNKRFIKKLPIALKKELINLPEPIPSRIENMLNEEFPDFREERLLAIDNDLELEEQKERAEARKMSAEDAGNYHAKLAEDFIKKHEEFKPMIMEIREV